MFGFSAREKAAKAALDWLAPGIASIKHQKLDYLAWRNGFLLGYFHAFITVVVARYMPSKNGDISELQSVSLLVFRKAAPEAAENMVGLSFILLADKDKGFMEGILAGEKVIRAMLGAPLPDDDQQVAIAKKMADEDLLGERLAPETYHERFIGSLLMVVLFSPLAERLGVVWEPGFDFEWMRGF